MAQGTRRSGRSGGAAPGPAAQAKVGPGVELPAGAWAFADCNATPFPGRPDPRVMCLLIGSG